MDGSGSSSATWRRSRRSPTRVLRPRRRRAWATHSPPSASRSRRSSAPSTSGSSSVRAAPVRSPSPRRATLLLRHADGILARLQAAQADLSALAEGEAGALRVGTYQSVGARVLPELLAEFGTAWPRVEVQLTESTDDGHLLDLVERGELDLSFVILPLPEGPFEVLELMKDPYALVVSAGSPLARRAKAPSLKQVAALPLIGFRQCRSIHLVENRFRDSGLEPRIVFRSDDNGTIQGLVAAGVGAALVPLLAVEHGHAGTAVLPLDVVPPRLIGIAWHRDRYRSPAALAFVQRARDLCARIEREQAESVKAA